MKNLYAAILGAIVGVAMLLGLTACGQSDNEVSGVAEKETPVIGYVSVGPISARHSAEEKDVQTAFKNAGMDMVYMPSSEHSRQVASFDKFVKDKVQAILLTPAQAHGWVKSLQAAKKAKIPVFILDGSLTAKSADDSQDSADSSDTDTNDADKADGATEKDESITKDGDTDVDMTTLYTSNISPSVTWAGEQAAAFINATYPDGAKGLMITGPEDSPTTIDALTGWKGKINASIKLLDSQNADWNTEKAIAETVELLQKYSDEAPSFIIALSDEMGLGVSQAVEDAGLTTKNIKIVSLDASKPALRALIKGQLASVIELNPLIGEKAATLVSKALAGEKVEKNVTVPSVVFTPEDAKKELSSRKY